MDNNQAKCLMTFLIVLPIVICGLITMACYNNHLYYKRQNDEQMNYISGGYEQITVPGVAGTVWQKKKDITND